MVATHKFAGTDGDGKNETPSWAKDTCCGVADEKAQRAHDASHARQAGDRSKAKERAYNQKRVHQQDS